MYSTADLVALSALQHYLFCPRQCALIHLEQIWTENRFTAEGRVLHEAADSATRERRGDVLIVRSLPLRSFALGVSGIADVVEFHGANQQPFPVEYKRGRPKQGDADQVQLCAQGLCLEDMLGVAVPGGALFYGAQKRRKAVEFTPALWAKTLETAQAVHALLARGVTPPPVPLPGCEACSLREDCLPDRLETRDSAKSYLGRLLDTS